MLLILELCTGVLTNGNEGECQRNPLEQSKMNWLKLKNSHINASRPN